MQIDSAFRTAAAAATPGAASAAGATATKPATSAAVSTTEFMRLLSTEMANQDPMKPMDPTETMTQLAQFSNLQQSSQISQYQSLAAANSFLGTQVTIPGSNGAPAVTGTVTGIDSSGVASGSAPLLVLSGTNQEYPLTAISHVTVPTAAAGAAPSTPAKTQ